MRDVSGRLLGCFLPSGVDYDGAMMLFMDKSRQERTREEVAQDFGKMPLGQWQLAN
jgi:hypothetical protein